MADISQIKLPNNTVLNLKDNKFRNWSTGSDTVDFLTVKSCTSNSQKTLKLYIDDDGALIVRKGDNQSDVDYYNVSVVSTLPATGNNKTFYFLSKTGTTGDVYDEYIYINNEWEKIGTTAIDLSGYALTEDIPTKVSQLTNDSGYLSSETVDSALSNTSENPVQNKVVKSAIDAQANALSEDIAGKLDAPSTTGTAGQVLGLDSNLIPAWIDPTSVTQTLTSGTAIATINGVTIYAPSYTDADGVSY